MMAGRGSRECLPSAETSRHGTGPSGIRGHPATLHGCPLMSPQASPSSRSRDTSPAPAGMLQAWEA